MSSLTKESAINIFNSRTQISAPGRYAVQVTNCGDFNKDLKGGASIVAIANFDAMTPFHMAQAKTDLASGDINKALNNNLSLSIRNSDYRPSKRERVLIDVDYVTTKDGKQALLVVGMTEVKVQQSAKVDFSSFLDDAEEVEAEATDATSLEA